MRITLGLGHIVQLGLRQEESIYCGMRFNRFTGFLNSTLSMNKGVPVNLEHWIQIITAIPEILSADQSFNRTTDKRIISLKHMFLGFNNIGQIL